MEDLSRGRRPRETRCPRIHLEVHHSTKLPKGIDQPSYQVIVTPTSSIDNCRRLFEEFSNLMGRTGLLAHCSLFSLAPTGPGTPPLPGNPRLSHQLVPAPQAKRTWREEQTSFFDPPHLSKPRHFNNTDAIQHVSYLYPSNPYITGTSTS